MIDLVEIISSVFKITASNGNRDSFRRNYIYLAKLYRFTLDVLDTYNYPKIQEISNLLSSLNAVTYLSAEEKKSILYALLKIRIIETPDGKESNHPPKTESDIQL